MNISIASYTYALTSTIASIQLVSGIFRNFISQQSPHITIANLKEGKAKSFTNLVFLINQTLFTLYNILGLAVSYNRGYALYRSTDLSLLDKCLQIFEIIYESIAKSLLFSTLILFLPVLKLITQSYSENFNTKKELKYVIVYICVRSLLYPVTYLFFQSYSMTSISVIEIINISECIILTTIFTLIDSNINGHFIYANPHCERTKALMSHLYKRFTLVSRIYILQLLIEVIFRSCLITLTIADHVKISSSFVECLFLFRFVSFSIQSYALAKLCNGDESKSPDNIFWTPAYNEDFIFLDPYEDKNFIDKIGKIYSENVVQPNGVIKHVNNR